MPLPTIETPTYELKLHSSNKKIKYRPFLVKEEKILILALDSKNESEITNAVKDVLKKCILTKGVDVDKLPTFDIEYIFLNIRAKSIGEDIKMTVTCPDDGVTQVPVTLYVDEFNIHYQNQIIQIREIVLKEIIILLEKYAIENSIDLILDSTSYLIASNSIDITDIINKQLENINIKLEFKDFENN